MRRPKLRSRLQCVPCEDRTVPTVITVTGAGDTIGPDGLVTLREALIAANTNAPCFDAPAGSNIIPDFINFNIAGSGVHTIKPLIELPKITDTVIIDGYSQPGSSTNTLTIGDNAKPLIELDGSLFSGANQVGINIGVANCQVSGLIVNRFPDTGILVSINGANARVFGNFIGTDATGTMARPNRTGVATIGDGTLIGSDGRNIISGNSSEGIYVGQNATQTQILNNYIGTTKNGDAALGNGKEGILDEGTTTIIGSPGMGNIIAANGFAPPDSSIRSGVFSNNQHLFVQSNRVGIGAFGEVLGNNGSGLNLREQSAGTVGGPTSGYGNWISGNKGPGIIVLSSKIQIAQNQIALNSGIGIDRGGDGVTPNAPNADLNYPILQRTYLNAPGQVGILGYLNAKPNTQYIIEFFTGGKTTHRDGNSRIGQTFVTTNAQGRATLNEIINATVTQGAPITATAINAATGGTSEFSAPSAFNGIKIYAVGAGAGSAPMVRVLSDTGSTLYSFNAYDAAFKGGVQVATGDVNGDGYEDIVTAAGMGGGPHVKVFDGKTGAILTQFMAYESTFTGGVFVAVGDINRDGFADIITGTGNGGGPLVKVFNGFNNTLMQSFFAYDSAFRGGVRVASGDTNSDGYADIATAAGPGGGPHVKIYDGATGTLASQFMAFDQSFTGGVYIATGDVNGDDRADIITGAGAGGGPQVKVFNGKDNSLVKSFFAYDQAFIGGVRVGSQDTDRDGLADIVTGAGVGGGPHVKVTRVSDLTALASSLIFDPGFLGGVFVG